MPTLPLTLQLGGGAEILFNGKREHKIEVSIGEDENFTINALLKWILLNMLNKCDRSDLLIINGTVRPGILLLVNDTDWEVLDGVSVFVLMQHLLFIRFSFQLHTKLHKDDVVTLLSTLHGG